MGKLERKIDPEALSRAIRKAGPSIEPMKKLKEPRHFSTYRGYRRNKSHHRNAS